MRSVSQGPRERLVAAAIALVQENGVAATGLAELLERSRCARRSLYQHFPGGKNELIDAATREAGTFARLAVSDLGETRDAAGVLDLAVRFAADSLERTDFRYGCPIAAAASAPADAGVVRDAAGAAFGDWIEALEGLLVREGRPVEEARSLARFVVGSIEGALLLSRAARSVEPLEDAARHLRPLLAG